MKIPESITSQLVYVDMIAKIHSVMEEFKNKKWIVSYSGGSDSDTVIWLMRYLGYEPKCVFIDNGLEYEATKQHVQKMKNEQGFDIDIIRPVKSIPICIREYGKPFLSKNVSAILYRMQQKDFDFSGNSEKTSEELSEIYKGIKAEIRWYTAGNNFPKLNINFNKLLKEFLSSNPLDFKISDKCCEYAKKKPILKYEKENNIELTLLGIRKSEGGRRNYNYKNCFQPSKSRNALFFPIFWLTNKEKAFLDKELNIEHSECYTKYGLNRTGCVGCPFNIEFEKELSQIQYEEPKLYKLAHHLFGDVYEYTKKYREFKNKKD